VSQLLRAEFGDEHDAREASAASNVSRRVRSSSTTATVSGRGFRKIKKHNENEM
jgi:hypothetical protein